MLHQLLQLLPDWLMQGLTIALIWGSIVGVLLWGTGARFSRSMLTLLAVTAGSWVGVRLPGIFGWGVDPMFVGIFGAIFFGIAAYLFHWTLVGIGLGAVAALWAGTAAWIGFDGPDQWHLGGLKWTGGIVTYLAQIWQSSPGKLGLVLPYACGAGLAGGVLIAVLWPRFGRCLLYGMVGPTLILATGLPLTARLRPDWLELAPASGQSQLLILFGFVAIGVTVQWCLTRTPREAKRDSAAGGSADEAAPSVRQSQGAASPIRDAASGSRARGRWFPFRRKALARYAPIVPVR